MSAHPRTLALLLTLFACRDPEPGKKHGTDGGDGTDDSEDTGDTGDTGGAEEDPGLAIIPAPTLVEELEGSFLLDEETSIRAQGAAVPIAELLAGSLRPSTNLELPVSADGQGILLRLDASLGLPAEGYTLDIDETGVQISASDEAGLFHGTQTLRQLLPPEALSIEPVEGIEWVLPAVHIEDAPRFVWRGLMIDVARHFFDVGAIKRQIDLMALHRMNRLHLHLTDDQGWRIEIESWPLLAEIGGSTEVGGGEGGYYTQEQYAEIVAYAAERQIVVVPEIDFPGHANAALASYGELNESGEPVEIYTGEWVISTAIWMDGESTRPFVEDVWREVAALTPGPYLHIGGDEAVTVSDEDYADFITWLQGVVAAEGKILVGWDEVGTVPLEEPFVAQHWFNEDRALAAVDQGAKLIRSPAESTYLDMKHDRDADFGQTWAGYIDLETAYDWDPVPSDLDETDVLGIEGPLWTEFVASQEQMDLMIWPRLAAHAELGWTAEDALSWERFRAAMQVHGRRLDALGVGYYQTPEVDWE